jgi:signal transduction histidine kinase
MMRISFSLKQHVVNEILDLSRVSIIAIFEHRLYIAESMNNVCVLWNVYVCQLEAGEAEVNFERFDVDELLNSVAKIVAPLLQQKQLALNMIKSSNVPRYLIGDFHRLKQILVNLLSNSIKFTSKGTISIEVSIEKEEKSTPKMLCKCPTFTFPTRVDRYVKFSVSDTGIGIDPKLIPLIFQPYKQVSLSLSLS